MSAALHHFEPNLAHVQTAAPRQLAPCGTDAAYRRHLRRQEIPCDDCLAAHRAAWRAWDSSRGPRRTTLGRPPRSYSRRNHILDEWVFFGGPEGSISFRRFAERMGMTLAAWERCYQRAQDDQDPRATGRRYLTAVSS